MSGGGGGTPCGNGGPGKPGALGTGGDGGSYDAGAGGGGYYGGGGGGGTSGNTTCSGGGGGGSSYVIPQASNASITPDTTGVPEITITPLVTPPTCANVAASTSYSRTVTVSLACLAPTGVAVTYTVLAAPAHGMLGPINQAKGAVDYTPQPGYSGADTFTYQASDVAGASNTAAATITVGEPPPTCSDVSVRTPPGGGTVPALLACAPPPGTSQTYAIVYGPAHGTLGLINQATGAVLYTSTPGYGGSDQFTYLAAGVGGMSNVATVTITIPPAPPACSDLRSSTPSQGSAITLGLPCVGPAGVSMSYAIVSRPVHGTLRSLRPHGSVIYAPTQGYVGSDRFTYRASNASGTSNTATATIHIPITAPTMNWSVNARPTYTLVRNLVVYNVPAGAQVKVACKGRGCPFKARTASYATYSACKGKRCRTKSLAGSRTVDLTQLFRGRQLGIGARLTISIVKPNTIGKVFGFTIRPSRQPITKPSCLAPGSTTPGKSC